MQKIVLFASLLGLATACHKDTEEPGIDFGPGDGFTMRDASAYATGQTDPTDWTRDDTWTTTEQQLFVGLSLPLDGAQLPASTWRIACYPNPATLAGGFAFAINANTSATVPTGVVRASTVLVDAHYRLLAANDIDISKNGNTFAPRLDPAKFQANALYRMYYVLYSPGQQVYYRGHGDIKLEK